MKWFILIVTLIAGAGMFYMFIYSEPAAGTPMATAQAYVSAAGKKDEAAVQALCALEGVDSAKKVAEALRGLHVENFLLSFKLMEAEPPRKGFMAYFQSHMLGIEMIRDGETWKIVRVSLEEVR
ncbi:MAG: hypothetical protein NTX50_02780 [Candidatus Sumerlaeota bacterium]|nr:hypothetical protein [Candidatus Sumerlaeota bacterium]